MRRYCLTLDLKDDAEAIRQYEEHHQKVWPEIIRSIKESGISSMQIYRLNTRLFMIMEVSNDFSFERKAELDSSNEKVEAWENLMWNYQKPLTGATAGSKWQLLNKIFDLSDFK
jgi:L-rhamnose mutarotase